MSRPRSIAAALLVAGTLTVPAALTTPAGAAPQPASDGAALVKVIAALDGDLTEQLARQLEDLGVVRGLELPTIDAIALTLPAAVVPVVAELPGVEAVVPQRRLRLNLYRSKEQINALGVSEPDRYRSGTQSFERPGVTGAGVTVGIIDSGIFAAHPGFGDRVVGGLNFEFSELVDSGIVPAGQWDAYAETTGATALQDEVGHGTHVAGTVGGDGSGAQSDRDLSGVAPAASFVSLKIASAANGVVEDVGFEENALAAIDYVIRHEELDVRLTNNSWGLLEEEPSTVPGAGEPTDFDAANAVVEAASAAGITMVFSAGNDGPEPGSINEDPGGAPSAITVAAACKGTEPGQGGSCAAGEITDFSSRGAADGTGPQVDVAAPGDQILAPVSPVSVLTPLTQCLDPAEPLYYCISGTSMAAPHVAGVVALMQEVDPDLLPAQAERCLETTAVDLLAPGVDISSGHGMVDTMAALRCAYALTAPQAVGGAAPAVVTPPAAAPTPPTTSGRSLPATGGGIAAGLAGLLAVGSALLLRRRSRVLA
jgi:serine protease AprX